MEKENKTEEKKPFNFQEFLKRLFSGITMITSFVLIIYTGKV
jgi:hypothetical protein